MYIDATLYGDVNDSDGDVWDVEVDVDVMDLVKNDPNTPVGLLVMSELVKVAQASHGLPCENVTADLEITIRGESFDIYGENISDVIRLLELLLDSKQDEDEMIGFMSWLGDAIPDKGTESLTVPNRGDFVGMYDDLDDFMGQAEIALPGGCIVQDEEIFIEWNGYHSEESPNGNLLIWRFKD